MTWGKFIARALGAGLLGILVGHIAFATGHYAIEIVQFYVDN